MTQDKNSDPDPLDRNLRALLGVAPERARLDPAAARRIADSLKQQVNQDVETERETARPLPRPRRAPYALLAAAAVFAMIAAAALWQRATAPAPTEPSGDRSKNERVANRSDASNLDLAASASNLDAQGAGMRRSLEDGAETPGSGEAPDRNDAARVLRGVVLLDEALGSLPREIEVWTRPLVDLPRVADARGHRFGWAGSERELEFELTQAFEDARAYGTDRLVVHVAAEGAGSAATVVTIRDSSVELTLHPQWRATGYVTDEASGSPIQGALVVAVDQVPVDALGVHPEDEGDVPSPSATTNAAGRFVLSGLRGDQEARLRASAPGYAPSWATARASVAGENAELECNLAMTTGGGVEGVVERKDGTRWGHALLIASRQDFHPTGPYRPLLTYGVGRADAEGRYSIDHLPPGMYVVLHFGDVETPTQETEALQMVQVKAEQRARVDFLGAASMTSASLRGRLVSANGNPIRGRSMTLSKAEARSEQETEWKAITTDADGRFQFPSIDSADYVLLVADAGFAAYSAIWRGTVEGAMEVEITMPSGHATFVARAADSDVDLANASGAWAMIERWQEDTESWDFAGFGRSLESFDVTLQDLPDGRYRGLLAPFREDLALARVPEFKVVDSGHPRIDVEIRSGASIEIEVVDPSSGEPVRGLSLSVRDNAGAEVPQQSTPITDAEGRATARGLPLGTVTLELQGAGRERAVRTYELRGPSAEPLRWELP